MTPENEERVARALESIANSFELIAESQQSCYALAAKRMEIEHPPKRAPTDATITRVPTAEDRLKEEQGASNEPIEEWIGLREQAVIDRTQKAS